LFHTTFLNPDLNTAATLTRNQPSFPEQPDSIPLEAIIPLIEETWKDEEYALGEHYDKMYSTLFAHAATLRHRLQRCSDPRWYEEIERELEEVDAKLCDITLKFEESVEYPE
jgi:hypothetical protein